MRNQPEINKVRTNEINKLTAIRFTYVNGHTYIHTVHIYLQTYKDRNELIVYKYKYVLQVYVIVYPVTEICYLIDPFDVTPTAVVRHKVS